MEVKPLLITGEDGEEEPFFRKLVYEALEENIGSDTAGRDVNFTFDPPTPEELFYPIYHKLR